MKNISRIRLSALKVFFSLDNESAIIQKCFLAFILMSLYLLFADVETLMIVSYGHHLIMVARQLRMYKSSSCLVKAFNLEKSSVVDMIQ